MAKLTPATLRKCHYPYPVYEAHIWNGVRTVVCRASFWSPIKKPIDPALGRGFFERSRLGIVTDGFVEQDRPGQPWLRFRDPTFDPASEPITLAKRRVTAKQARDALADLLANLDGTSEAIAASAQRARNLLAA